MGKRTVEIPEELYVEIEDVLDKLDMKTVDECVAFILEALFSGEFSDDELSKEEESEMRERLADLGYM